MLRNIYRSDANRGVEFMNYIDIIQFPIYGEGSRNLTSAIFIAYRKFIGSTMGYSHRVWLHDSKGHADYFE